MSLLTYFDGAQPGHKRKLTNEEKKNWKIMKPSELTELFKLSEWPTEVGFIMKSQVTKCFVTYVNTIKCDASQQIHSLSDVVILGYQR